MRMLGSKFLAAFIFVLTYAAAARDSAWFARNWQSDKGLPNNTVFALAQTTDGYLWLGTSIGLLKFDGARFQKYPFTNSVYGGNRGVVALLRSRGGGLWMGMDRGGVIYLNGDQTKVFTRKDGLEDGQVQTLEEDNDGTLWIAYLGNAFRQIKNGKVGNLSLPNELTTENFEGMACDNEGRLWWAAAGQVWLHQSTGFVAMAHTGGLITSICAARNGGVWVADSKLHLFYCDTQGKLKDCGEFTTERPGSVASSLHEDASGAIWLGMSSGEILRWYGAKFESTAVLHPQIQNMLEDREGNMWAGTQGGGLYQICRRVIQLTGVESGLPADMLSSLCDDGKGGLWAVTENGSLVHRSDGKWQVVTNESWAGEFLVCANTGRNGTLWIGTRNRKLYCWRDGHVVKADWPEAANTIQSLLCSSTGDLWIGGLNYLQRLRDGKLTSYNIPPGAHSIRAMAEDSDGQIWIGSSRGVLLRVRGEEATPVKIPDLGTAASVRCLLAGNDGSIWIGHAGLGVGRIKNGHYAHVGTEQGLFDDYISQIIPDDYGWFWFGSDRGIFKVRKQELRDVMDGRAERVRSILYSEDPGVASLQAVFGRSPNAGRSGDGRLWIPTHSGLAVIDPRPRSATAAQPETVLERVILDGQVIAQASDILPEAERPAPQILGPDTKLRLPPDYRRLEIEFTALSFDSPENIHFRYKLEGLDQDWVEAGAERNAAFSRLPASEYHFKVQVCSSEGVWNTAGPTLALTVLPYFWQTWWFIAGVAVVAIGIIGGGVRYFEKRRLQRQLARIERERAVERERARIAKDIHDDLGASLTRITMLSQSALNKPELMKTPATELSRIYDTARSMTNAMDEIVWAINPSHDTLESLAAYFAEFVQEFLSSTGLRFNLEMPLALPQWNISSEVRHNLFLALKEALNNVVKHSNASDVIVMLEVRSNGFVLSVKDNGRGFDGENEIGNGAATRRGNGLNNMHRRLEELGGHCMIRSETGHGTHVAFEIKLST